MNESVSVQRDAKCQRERGRGVQGIERYERFNVDKNVHAGHVGCSETSWSHDCHCHRLHN